MMVPPCAYRNEFSMRMADSPSSVEDGAEMVYPLVSESSVSDVEASTTMFVSS